MNNRNKILVGCLALLLVLSVGYALFSETITINGTATAKGSFDIGVTCQTGLANVTGLEENAIESLKGPGNEGSFSGDTCTASGNKVTFNTNLNAPGAMRYYTIKATNNGTIDAWAPIVATPIKDGKLTTQVCMGTEMKNKLDLGGSPVCSYWLMDSTSYSNGNVADEFEDLSYVYIIEKDNGELVNLLELPEEEAMTYLNEDGDRIKLPVGASIYYVGKMYINEDYEWSTGVNMIDFNMSVDYTLNFEQQTN